MKPAQSIKGVGRCLTHGVRLARRALLAAGVAALGVLCIQAEEAKPALPGQGLPGVWEGVLEARGVPVRLQVRVARGPDGKLMAVLDSPDQGAMGAVIEGMTLEGTSVRFALPRLGVSYTGELDEAGATISGQWSQAGMMLPLALARTGPPPDPRSIDPVDPNQVIPTEGVAGRGLPGRWGGVVDAGGRPLRLVLAVTTAGEGKLSAALESLDQGPIRITVDGIAQQGAAVQFHVARIAGKFTGTMSGDGASITGEWNQLGTPPVNLTFYRMPARSSGAP